MNILILKSYKEYSKGDIITVSHSTGMKLIKRGIALAHKAMYDQKEK